MNSQRTIPKYCVELLPPPPPTKAKASGMREEKTACKRKTSMHPLTNDFRLRHRQLPMACQSKSHDSPFEKLNVSNASDNYRLAHQDSNEKHRLLPKHWHLTTAPAASQTLLEASHYDFNERRLGSVGHRRHMLDGGSRPRRSSAPTDRQCRGGGGVPR